MLDYFLLAASGFVAWIVSTVGGGGGATLLVPLVSFIAGAQAIAPVTTVATLIAGGGRVFVFWKEIDRSVVAWALPGAAIGALLGAMGPIMNTLYLNAGVTKGRMVGTKTAISLPMHLVKIGTYTTHGAMSGQPWLFGLAAGTGALASTGWQSGS